MNSLKFVLNVKPYSINRLHYRDGRRKTVEAREWEMTVFDALDQPELLEAIADFRSQFDPSKHGIIAKLTAYYPADHYYNKQGFISGRTFDQTNWEKPFIDLLFLEKYATLKPPFGVENLKIDDKYIVRITSTKKPHPKGKHEIHVHLRIVSNQATLHTKAEAAPQVL